MHLKHRPGISTREVLEFLEHDNDFAKLKRDLETKDKSVKWLVIQRKYAIQMIGFLLKHKELFPHKRRVVGRKINFVEQFIVYLNYYLDKARKEFKDKMGILSHTIRPREDAPIQPSVMDGRRDLVRGEDLHINGETYATYRPKGI